MTLDFSKQKEFVKRIGRYLELTKSLPNDIDRAQLYDDEITDQDIIEFKNEIDTNFIGLNAKEKDGYIKGIEAAITSLRESYKVFKQRWQQDFKRRNPGNELNKEKIKMLFFLSEVTISIARVEKAIPKLNNHSKAIIKSNPTTITTLNEAVITPAAETEIYTILIAANLIDKDSRIFKDKVSGNVGHFYSTIISFFEKGYFRKRPSTQEYLNICINTFSVTPSLSTAKNHKTRSSGLTNIPPYTDET